MSLDNILERRALRLKAALTENGRPEPGILSTIYPAVDYGANDPHVVKTPASIPGFNDKAGEPDFDPDEESEKEKGVDPPGPSKSPSFTQPVVPGEAAMVPDAHKQAAFELGYFGEGRSERFIERCVEIITGVKKVEQVDPPTETSGGSGGDGGSGGLIWCDTKGDLTIEDNAKAKLMSIAKKFKSPKVEPDSCD
jgi:hypothetical protein